MKLGDPSEQSERTELLRGVRRALARLEEPLEVMAEKVLGLESRVDLVTRDGGGGVVLVFLAERGRELEQVADAAAQCVWHDPRISDWAKLAPERGLRSDLPVHGLVLARRFPERARLAAGSLATGRLQLGFYRPGTPGAGEAREPRIEIEGVLPSPPEAFRPRSAFRTALNDDDL